MQLFQFQLHFALHSMISSVNDMPTNSSAFNVEHITPTEEELRTVPQRSYKCDICGLQVKTLANLRIHRVKTHRIVEVSSTFLYIYLLNMFVSVLRNWCSGLLKCEQEKICVNKEDGVNECDQACLTEENVDLLFIKTFILIKLQIQSLYFL